MVLATDTVLGSPLELFSSKVWAREEWPTCIGAQLFVCICKSFVWTWAISQLNAKQSFQSCFSTALTYSPHNFGTIHSGHDPAQYGRGSSQSTRGTQRKAFFGRRRHRRAPSVLGSCTQPPSCTGSLQSLVTHLPVVSAKLFWNTNSQVILHKTRFLPDKPSNRSCG